MLVIDACTENLLLLAECLICFENLIFSGFLDQPYSKGVLLNE